MGKTRPQEPLASRQQAGHTPRAAATLLGVSYRTWKDWEGGFYPMPPQMLLLYRHLAGVQRIPFRSCDYARPEV